MPGLTINPFATDAYSVATLTEAINRLPYNIYGRVGELGIFEDKGVTTTSVIVEEQGGVLNLLPTSPRGAPSLLNKMGKRKARSFVIPHIGLDDVVLPEEVQGVRAFGSASELASINQIILDKLQAMKNKHDQTREWLKVGALKGVLLDADGSTVLYNFFDEFGITAQTVTFPFSTTTTDVLGVCNTVNRWMEDHLHGDTMSSVYCLCSPTFFDALVAHPNVKAAFMYFQTQQALGGDYRKGFKFGGITFEEYRGTASDPTGTAHRFIPDGSAQFFPMGTTSTFKTFFAPADFNETVNTIGLPYYSKQAPRKFDRGTDLHTQSNPLPICLRPELLVQGNLS
jgi:hypothetical protein